MKITRAEILCTWKVHSWSDKKDAWYVGPVHGRVAIATYPTKEEAIVALEMQRWFIKFFKLK